MENLSPKSDSLSLETHYRSLVTQQTDSRFLYASLATRDWFHAVSEFDDRSGECLSRQLSSVIAAASKHQPLKYPVAPNDQFGRVFNHANRAIQKLLGSLHPRLLREHAIVPVHAAREFDSACVSWLSRRNGRTIREKLAGRPYVKAVRRIESFDTPENRLFKRFCERFADVLQIREDCFSPNEDEQVIHGSIIDWLRSEIGRDIGPWENFTPNNSLLQNRDYRRIWDSWQWIQSLDDTTRSDRSEFARNWSLALFWETASLLANAWNVRWFEQPCYFNYDTFSIRPAMSRPDGFISLRGVHVAANATQEEVGAITGLQKEKHFGFVAMSEGKSVFFHSSKFINRAEFDEVEIGTNLHFDVEQTPKGLAAHNIVLADEPYRDVELSLAYDQSLQMTLAGQIFQTRPVKLHSVDEHFHFSVNGKSTKLRLSPESTQAAADYFLGRSVSEAFQRISDDLPGPIASVSKGPTSVDLTQIRPQVSARQSLSRLQARLLWQKWSQKSEDPLSVDLGKACGVVLGDDIATVSILSLYSTTSDHSPAVLDDAASHFARSIKAELGTEELTYIVPDSVDDFSLNTLRRNLNRTFADAEPLPRSIAAIFDWQASEDFASHQVREGDIVVVLDSIGSEVSFTCIQARLETSGALQNSIADSGGIYWERYPTQAMDLDTSSIAMGVQSLENESCPFAHEIASLCGFQSVSDSTVSEMSWSDLEGKVFTARPRSKESKPGVSVLEICSRADIRSYLKTVGKRGQVFFLAIGDVFLSSQIAAATTSSGRATHRILDFDAVPARGGDIHQSWQKISEDIPLWRDHLPDLSIKIIHDGLYQPFFLVRSKTVAPRRNKTDAIEIAETFVLPQDTVVPEFPLAIGSGSQEVRYAVQVHSPAFPLDAPTPCRLEMDFTFGADNPYTLRFIPLSPQKARFQAAVGCWEKLSAFETEITFPEFPTPLSWKQLEQFPKDDGHDTSDLIDWASAQFEKFANILQRVKRAIKTPSSTPSLQPDVDKRLRKGLRFPVLTIWRDGRSISDMDAPGTFRNEVLLAIPNFDEMAKLPSELGDVDKNLRNTIERLADEAFYFLCLLHCDSPDGVGSALLRMSTNYQELDRYRHNIAYSLGRVEKDWQQAILQQIVDNLSSKSHNMAALSLGVLGIAAWRDSSFVLKIPQVQLVIESLNHSLRLDSKNLDVKGRTNGKPAVHYSIVQRLELLLVLLRTRSSNDPMVSGLLAPRSRLANSFSESVDAIIREVAKHDAVVETFVKLNVEKPASLYNTPDLLYALQLYLSGDSAANAIQILKIDSE